MNTAGTSGREVRGSSGERPRGEGVRREWPGAPGQVSLLWDDKVKLPLTFAKSNSADVRHRKLLRGRHFFRTPPLYVCGATRLQSEMDDLVLDGSYATIRLQVITAPGSH
ncbi:unnamed protein product [Pleuronectes platessa]|uniref:Uncharacterized protein n=1 Tax=Pleuronectes platessa TaxID=8262 RepID=A0A9N7Z028_PLEPL|nr:unnamed protein product [Pleuronectes platessa]